MLNWWKLYNFCTDVASSAKYWMPVIWVNVVRMKPNTFVKKQWILVCSCFRWSDITQLLSHFHSFVVNSYNTQQMCAMLPDYFVNKSLGLPLLLQNYSIEKNQDFLLNHVGQRCLSVFDKMVVTQLIQHFSCYYIAYNNCVIIKNIFIKYLF